MCVIVFVTTRTLMSWNQNPSLGITPEYDSGTNGLKKKGIKMTKLVLAFKLMLVLLAKEIGKAEI